MITLLRLILFFLCSLGSWELLRRITNVNVLFLPSLTIAVQTGILFLAGLAGWLTGGVIVLLVVGIFGLVYSIFRDRGISFLKYYLNAGYLFLVMAGIALFLFLYWQKFYHYDNFSHWGLVVRQMLQTNRFPDMSDVLIQFRNYPLGSAVYIFFLTRVVSGSEGVMMFAQAYMMLTCIMPVMIFFTKDRVAGYRTGCGSQVVNGGVYTPEQGAGYGQRTERGKDCFEDNRGTGHGPWAEKGKDCFEDNRGTGRGPRAESGKDCRSKRGNEQRKLEDGSSEVHTEVMTGNRFVRLGFGFLVLLAAANFFLVYNIPVQDLLVDSLLPLTGMCAFLYAWIYGRELRKPGQEPGSLNLQTEPLPEGGRSQSTIWQERLAFAGIACYMIQLVQIKNSGWFFAAFLIVWILIGIRRDKRVLARILVAVAPVVSAVLWWIHYKLVFSGAGPGKHAMSISYYLTTLSEKTGMEIGNICRSFLKFTVSWRDIWLTVALAALVCVLVLVFCRKLLKPFGKLMLFSLVMFVIYQGFLLWMYLFSMPAPEAAYLAEAERYVRTILMAVVYLLVLVMMRMIADAQLSDVKAGTCALATTAGLCLYLVAAQGTLYTVFYYEDVYGERDWIEDMVREYDVPMGATYCFVPPEDDGYYSSYLAQYLFSTCEVEEFFVEEPSDMDQITAEYVFLVEDGNGAAQEWVREHYPEQAGNSVIVR